jgi:cytochrome c-type biogenesis protein CcmH
MIFLLMFALALLLMLPMVFAFRGRRGRDQREAALALHRAQLAELKRDLGDERIAPAEYSAAKLEVERRVLTADALREPAQDGNSKFLLLATIIAVPAVAFALYLPGSTPHVPSMPHRQVMARQAAEQQKYALIIAALRGKLAVLDANSVPASEGQAYLAEELAEQAGQITPEALALFRQSLANAPADASWRQLDVERVAEATAQ